jgi:DinB family protein
MATCDLESVWTWPAATVRREPLALSAELQLLRDAFQEAAMEAAALAAPLTDAQFAWKPAANVWSIGECLSHLNATARHCLPKLDIGISQGIAAGLLGDGPFRYGWLDRLTVRASEPSGWHLSSPIAFQPAPGESRDEILEAFQAFQNQLVARVRRANGLDLARVRVTSPVARWRRFSLGTAFAVLAAHQRRHLCQARHVAALPQFPR